MKRVLSALLRCTTASLTLNLSRHRLGGEPLAPHTSHWQGGGTLQLHLWSKELYIMWIHLEHQA